MYINITDSKTADKGGSGGLIHYLDRENRTDMTKQPEYWFNQERIEMPSDEVKSAIDNNMACAEIIYHNLQLNCYCRRDRSY